MTYLVITIVIVLIVIVIMGMITLHNHVDKTTKEMMVRFSMVHNNETSGRNQDNLD